MVTATACAADVGLLRGFAAAAQHHDHYRAALHVVHAPAGAKVLAHFKYTRAHRFHVAQVAHARLAQPRRQAPVSEASFRPSNQALNSSVRLIVNTGKVYSVEYSMSMTSVMTTVGLTFDLDGPAMRTAHASGMRGPTNSVYLPPHKR